MRHSCVWFVGLVSLFLVLGCDSGDEASDGASGSVSCQGQGDCGEASACVQAGNVSVCQLNCSLSADLCGAEASCAGVGAASMSVNVCQPAPEAEAETQAEPVPEEQPTLPCSTDEDCQKFSEIAICAMFEGVRDCTIPCEAETDCDMPTVMGVNIDFLTCLADEGDTSRNACLPDKACWANPTSCISGLDDFMNMGMGEDDDDMDGDMPDSSDLDGSFGDFDF